MFKRILSVVALLWLVPFLCLFSLDAFAAVVGFWLTASGLGKAWTAIFGWGRNVFTMLGLLGYVVLLVVSVTGGGTPQAPEPERTIFSIVLLCVMALGWPLVDILNVLLPDPE